MAKHTDRYEDAHLINLATNQYEQQLNSTLPSEIVYLPSAGKIYPKDDELRTGKLEMRYMTAYDEDILTNPSYLKDGVLLDKLLEALITTPGVNIKNIAEVDKDALIVSARILGYGSEYPVTIQDPKTKVPLERVVDLKSLKHKPFDIKTNDLGEMRYELDEDTVIYFSFLTNTQIKTLNRDKVSELLKLIIKQVNKSRKPEDIEEFIRYKFLAKESKKFREYVEKNSPGLDLNYTFEGEDGGTFTAMFRLGGDLFWF